MAIMNQPRIIIWEESYALTPMENPEKSGPDGSVEILLILLYYKQKRSV